MIAALTVAVTLVLPPDPNLLNPNPLPLEQCVYIHKKLKQWKEGPKNGVLVYCGHKRTWV